MDLDIEKLLDEEQRELLDKFLKEGDAEKFFIEWMVEFGFSRFWANVCIKGLIPGLKSLLGKFVIEGSVSIHNKLINKLPFYKKLFEALTYQLIAKIKEKPEEQLGPLQLDKEILSHLNDIEAQLALISLSLDVNVSLHLAKKPQDLDPDTMTFLGYENAFLPRVGRDEEMKSLFEFCEHPDFFRFQVITGDGGMGKSRLALEFASSLKEEKGWDAGFLDKKKLKKLADPASKFQDRWEPIVPTFIIIDYAGENPGEVSELIHRCYELSEESGSRTDLPPVRLLLLERTVSETEGWYPQMVNKVSGGFKGWVDKRLDSLWKLSRFSSGEERDDPIQLVEAFFKQWEKKGIGKSPELPRFSQEGLRQFQIITEGRPLLVQLAALHACKTGDVNGMIGWSRGELVHWSVEREKDYIQRECADDLCQLVERIAASLVFFGPRPKEDSQLKNLLVETLDADRKEVTEVMERILPRLHGSAQDSQGDHVLIPLHPDLTAAVFADTVLKEVFSEKRRKLLVGLMEIGHDQVLENLFRSAGDLNHLGLPELAQELTDLVSQIESVEVLLRIEAKLPEQTSALAELALKVIEKILALLGNEVSEPNQVKRSRLLDKLGPLYNSLNRFEEARIAVERAVEIRENLATENPEKYSALWAMSLNNLGHCLFALGLREDALKKIEKSFEIVKRLVAEKPHLYLKNFVISLGSLSQAYAHFSRLEDALRVAQTALKVVGFLDENFPSAFEIEKANIFSNLGSCYSSLGQFEKAVDATGKAEKIYELLAKKKPDAYETTWAGTLTNLGDRYSSYGNHKKAIELTEKAIEIYERLAKVRPDEFEREWANCLVNLGAYFARMRQMKESLNVTEKAEKVQERLAKAQPDVFEREWATSLNNLGASYSSLGRLDEAMKTTQKAVDVRKRLARERPDVFEKDYAKSIGLLASIFEKNREYSLARDRFYQAIKILNPHFQKNPLFHRTFMLRLIMSYGDCCKKTGFEPDHILLSFIATIMKKSDRENEATADEGGSDPA